MPEQRLRVVIAGGGAAGLEALHGLHVMAPDRVELTLVAPEDDFVYRPVGAVEPFGVGRTRQVSIRQAAVDARAELVAGTVASVDPDAKVVTTTEGDSVGYDALLLTLGATAVPVVEHATTWDDRSDAETLGGLIRDIEEGYHHGLAVVIPPGPGWPLRGYELAIYVALAAKNIGADHRTTLVTPDPEPLTILNSGVLERIYGEIANAGVTVVSANRVEVDSAHVITLVLHPSGERIEVDRVLALPALRGRPIAGIPTNSEGFIDVDDHCRIPGLDGVWAAGDATAFPLKSGGFAAEQADVAAEDIAASAGTDIDARPFDPSSRARLVGLPAGRFLNEWLALGEDEALRTDLPSTGVPILTYLTRDLSAGWRGTP